MMTLDEFKALPYNKIFATGVLPNAPEGLYMTDTNPGKMLRWVATKGRIDDWAIYCHWEENDIEYIARGGDKVTGAEHIQRCVPCDNSVLQKYRY